MILKLNYHMNKIINFFVMIMVTIAGVSAQSNIQKAIDQQDYKAVQKLDKDINQVFEADGIKLTPLSYASIKGEAEMVSLLLKNGASAKQITEGSDALMYAAKGGNLECVQLLVKAGAQVMNEGKDGMTARDYAVQAGHSDVAIYLNEQLSAEIEKRKAAPRTKITR